MIFLLSIIVGTFTGVAFAIVLTKLKIAYRRWPYALAVVAAAVIYPVALAANQPEGYQVFSYAGLVAFVVIATLGMARSPWWIVAGLFLHALFDLAALLAGFKIAVGATVAPLFGSAIEAWCIGFDLVLAVVFMFRVCISPEPTESHGKAPARLP